MNRKLFKRLLIATTMLSPVALVTPMILTSCNNGQEPIDSGKLISLGDFNSLLKTKKDNEGKDTNFWLNVIDFHGDSFLGATNDKNENQVRKFYSNLVTLDRNELINNLKSDEFEVTSNENNAPTTKETTSPTTPNYNESKKIVLKKTKDKYQDQSKIDKIAENLSTSFRNLHLSNIFDSIVMDEFGELKPQTNATGIIINWNHLNKDKFKVLLSQIDVECEITIINDKAKITNDDTTNNQIMNKIKKSNQFSIKYTFTPKTSQGYKWGGFDGEKANLPLVVTLNDYIDDIQIIDNFETYKNSTLIDDPIDKQHKANTLELSAKKIDANFSDATKSKDEITKLLNLGSNDPTTATDTKPIDLNTSNATNNFGKYINTFEKGTEANAPAFSKLKYDNLSRAMLNDRLDVKLYGFDSNDINGTWTTTVKILISSKQSRKFDNVATWSPDYDWFLGFDQNITNGLNIAKINYTLTITNK